MKRDGNAEIGVSISLNACASRFAACGLVLIGGAGRANGFGGPCAPALRRAPAEGDGGGNTTPCEGCAWPGCPVAVFVGCDADDAS
jgi:hypothetical protein